MKLNHINLPVRDVQQAAAFFEEHFGFRCEAVKGEHIIAVLKGEENFALVLMKSKETVVYPQAFHIGFLQKDKEAVDRIFQQLEQHTALVLTAPGKIRDTYGFYFNFEDILIEVSSEMK